MLCHLVLKTNLCSYFCGHSHHTSAQLHELPSPRARTSARSIIGAHVFPRTRALETRARTRHQITQKITLEAYNQVGNEANNIFFQYFGATKSIFVSGSIFVTSERRLQDRISKEFSDKTWLNINLIIILRCGSEGEYRESRSMKIK